MVKKNVPLLQKEQSKILIIKLGALGDFFRAIPIFYWIRLEHKDAEVVLLTSDEFTKLAESLGIIDKVIPFSRRNNKAASHKKINKSFFLYFDIVYDLQFVDRTKFYRLSTLCYRLPEWHCMSSENKFISSILFYKRTCPSIAKLSDPIILDASIHAKYGISTPFVVMAPFCSASSAWHKQWPVNCYLEVAKHIHQSGYQVVVLGSKNDDGCAQIQKSSHIHSLIGETELQDLIQLMPHASIAIGNDTGIMHLAELCQIPTIVIMSGVNDPNKAPKGPSYIQLLETPITDISVHRVIAAFDDVSRKSQ